MVEPQAIQVAFCSDLSQPADVVLVPLTGSGFLYPMPSLEVDLSALPALDSTLAFGNVVDFGADRDSRRVFGVFISAASDWEDYDMLIQTLQYGLYHISTAVGVVATVALAPVSETENYLYYQLEGVLNYLKPRKLLVCVQSPDAKSRVVGCLTTLKQLHAGLQLPQTRSEAIEEMKKNHYSCQICREYASNAYRSPCCESVVCGVCARYHRHCPKCMNLVKWQENKFVRGLVGQLIYVCVCEDAFPLSEEGAHVLKCPLAQYTCKICDGERRNPLTREDFKAHLKTTHKGRVEQELMG